MALKFRATLLPADFEAAALNDFGQIVGTRRDRAVVWRNGRLSILAGKTVKEIGRSRDSALAVSSNGLVAGRIGWIFGEPFQQPGLATLWRGGKRIEAPRVANFSNASFYGVNARDEAVGFAGTATMWEDRDASGELDAGGIITNQHGKALYFDGKTIRIEGWGSLNAINDSGATVGELAGQAVFRANARSPWVKLATGYASGVSPKGLVCGNRVAGDSKQIQSSVTIDGKTEATYFPLWRGFLWSSGKLVDLPPLPGFDTCRALGVNDAGWIVGSSGDDKKVATLWRNAKPTALDALTSLHGWKLTEACALSPLGKILCAAEDAKGNRRSVVLSSIR